METIPRELIEIIMSMVPTDDLVTKFRAVNKRYFALSQSLVSDIGPSFKRNQTSNDHQIMVLARDYASITSLNISKWDISVSALRVVLTKFPRLKVLRLPPLYLSQGNELLKHNLPSLTSLTMEIQTTYSTHFSSSMLDVTSLNPVFPNLEHMELTDSPSQTNVENLLQGMRLKSLVVHGCGVTRIANMPLLKTFTIINTDKEEFDIKDCPMIETLNIMFCDLRRFDFLQELPNLQHLTLQRGFQDQWGREEFAYDSVVLVNNLVKYCPNLKTLRIYRYKVTSKDLERLVFELPNLKKIVIASSKHDEALPETALLLQEKKKEIEIIVAKRKFTMGIDLDVFNNLMKVEKTSGPFVECHYCHLHHQCAPEIHKEVCLKWPAWSCFFTESGCTKTGMTKEELRVHIGKCNYYFIKCPMDNCGETIRRHERQEHDKKHMKTFEFRLKETRMICPNLQRGCLEMFATKSDMLNHVSKCQQSHCLCMSCKESFASIDQCTKHMAQCHVVHKKTSRV
jgi:KaiC/GvpD/RAD55 family RecA-like ATPase